MKLKDKIIIPKYTLGEEITNAIETAGFSPTVRGEKLSLEEFCTLSDIFASK